MHIIFIGLSFFYSFNLFAGLATEGENYLKSIRTGSSQSLLRIDLKSRTSASVAKELTTDNARIAFWLNLYNGLVQEELTLHPRAYKERRHFFAKKILVLKDVSLSLDDIEHGILRHSKSLYSFGYFNHFFIENWEKRLRVEILDPRIHFALNCGAESCPAILFYDVRKIDLQLDKATAAFLSSDIEFDLKSNSMKLSRLFFWFNADFGGHQGIIALVQKYLDLPVNKNTSFSYKEYNWDLALSKYGEI